MAGGYVLHSHIITSLPDDLFSSGEDAGPNADRPGRWPGLDTGEGWWKRGQVLLVSSSASLVAFSSDRDRPAARAAANASSPSAARTAATSRSYSGRSTRGTGMPLASRSASEAPKR